MNTATSSAIRATNSKTSNKAKGKQPNEKRQKLMDLSQLAKERKKMMLAKAKTDAEAMAIACLSINDIILSVYEADNEGANEWQTFKQWADKGYKIKKGSTAFYIWAKPIKAVNKSTIETPEGDKEHESNYKYWPMCGLFNNLQVEKREDKPQSEKNQEVAPKVEEVPSQETAPQAEDKPAQIVDAQTEQKQLKKVNVADFRGSVEHLQRVFNVDRHACVNDKEKEFWKTICLRVLAEVESLVCSRAKPEDLEERERIILKVREYFNMNNEPEPTPPNKPSKSTETESEKEEAAPEVETTENPFICDNFQGKQEARKDRYEERAAKAEQKADAHYNHGHKMAEVIPFGQPILVGHHSEKRDRAHRGKIVKQFDKSMEERSKAEHYSQKAETVGRGGIASDDPEALAKLKEKLSKKEELQTLMKEANKGLKKGDDQALEKLGFKTHQIEMLKKPDFAGRPGFPSYKLTNNNAEIRRLKKRIEGLEKLYQSEPVNFENDDLKIYVDDGRIHVEFFGGKPSEEVRKILKQSYSFRFSRHSSTWTRKATQNAVFMVDYLIKALENVSKIYD